jgi:hypothetical protein
MKKLTILFLSMLVGLACFSRVNNGSDAAVKFNPRDTVTASVSIPEPAILLDDIMRVTGLQQNFELKAADVMNIEASIQHKKRYILYNPAFISQLNSVAKNKWATTALLAHEVGHHLNGHTIKKSGSNIRVELEADEYAGFILNKMGATLAEAEEVMYYVAKQEDSKTHPARSSRILAIQKGWLKAAQ